MSWNDLCFAHWQVDPTLIAATLPPGLEPDLYEGSSWISIVPFAMSNIHLINLPTLPGFNYVPELNVRTYIRAGNRSGVWFYSLDAASLAVVAGARIGTGLPYHHAKMDIEVRRADIVFQSRRVDERAAPVRFHATYRAVNDITYADPDSIEAFLHERYHFASLLYGRLVWGQVAHTPYPLQGARVDIRENGLTEYIDHKLGLVPDLCYYSRGVDVIAGYAG